MQFGRVYGIGLIVLGLLLCGYQAKLALKPNMDRQTAETQAATTSEHRPTALPAIVGTASFVIGVVILATSRRRGHPEQPDAKHAIK